MLFMCPRCVLLSYLECSVKQVPATDPSAHITGAGRLLAATSIDDLKLTNAMMTARS